MTENNVTEINSKKKKKADGDKDKPPSPKAGNIDRFLLQYLQRKNNSDLPPFMNRTSPHRPFNGWIYKKTAEATRMVWIDEKTKTAKLINLADLTRYIDSILDIFNNYEEATNIYCLSFAAVSNLAKKFECSGRQLTEWPEPFGFLSTPGYVFKRMEFDPVLNATRKDFPFLAKALERMTNAEAFCQRVGSMFVEGADRKQVVWLYGDGDSGKSLWFDLLKTVVGEFGYGVINERQLKNDHGLYPLIDRKLWIGEEISPKFLMSSQFKILTGGAPVQVNQKNKDQFNAMLKGIAFLNSNDAPAVSNDSGLLNRIIACHNEVVPLDERVPRTESKKLAMAELPEFLGYCITSYAKLGPGATITPQSTEDLTDAISEFESPMAICFEDLFEEDLTSLGKDAKVSAKAFQDKYDKWCREYPNVASEFSLAQFRTYVKTRTGRSSSAFSVVSKVDGICQRCIPGIKIKR
jgi:hypothetical protein